MEESGLMADKVTKCFDSSEHKSSVIGKNRRSVGAWVNELQIVLLLTLDSKRFSATSQELSQ
jgi:hypothetical protein